MRTSNSYYSDLTQQMNVIGALVMRELHVRFGRNNVGYLWLIGEPLTLASVIALIHGFQGGSHIGGGMPPVAFGLLGYCLFIIFRGIFNRAESLVESSLPLMYHRMVSILNVSIARVVIEGTGCVCSLIILMTLCVLLGYGELPARLLYLILSLLWMTWLSFAMGLNVTYLTHDRPTLGRLVHPFAYFMMPLSGGFFAVNWLPESVQRVVVWNPMVCIFEYARYGMFETASDKFLFPAYINGTCAVLTYMGLLGIRRLRSRIHL